MNYNNKDFFDKYMKNRTLQSTLDMCLEGSPTMGSCVGCFENNINIVEVHNMFLCEDCIFRLKNKVDENVNVNMDYLNLDGIHSLLLEYTLFFDMKKMQDVADKDYNGDLKALLKNYNVNAYKILPDKIDFQTSAITGKKSKLNKLMIDFEGEFTTDTAALKATPDGDGTMAPLKVHGKGVVTPPMSQAHANPTTPGATPPLHPPTSNPPANAPISAANPQVHTNAPANISSGGVPNKMRFVIGANDTITATYVSTNTQYYAYNFSGLYGAKDMQYTIVKAELDRDATEAILEVLMRNIETITSDRFREKYTLSIYEGVFLAHLNPKSLLSTHGTQYDITWNDTFLNNAKSKAGLKVFLKTSSNVEDRILIEIGKGMSSLGLFPDGALYLISDTNVETSLKSINKDRYLFNAIGDKTNKKFIISMKIADYQDDPKAIVYELENNIADIADGGATTYSINETDPTTGKPTTYIAILVKGSSIKGNIVYKVTGSGATNHFEVEISKLTDIEGQLKKAVRDKLMANVGDDGILVSDTKKGVLTKKASPSKETLLNDLSKSIKNRINKIPNSIVRVDSVNFGSGNNITSISITIVDMVGFNPNINSSKDYVKNYKDDILNSIAVIGGKVTDAGIDNTQCAYVNIDIIDKKYINELVGEFKLYEFVDFLMKNKRLNYLVEGLKRRA